MKKNLKKVLSLLMVALLLVTSVPAMTFAVDSQGKIEVTGNNGTINIAKVKNLMYPYNTSAFNNNYEAYCGDADIDIHTNYEYNATFSVFNGSNKIPYVLEHATGSKEVIQQVIWRIIHGNYKDNPSNNVKNAANNLWTTLNLSRPESEFPSNTSGEYSKLTVIAYPTKDGDARQPILFRIEKKLVVKFYDFNNNVVKTELVNFNGSATAPTLQTRDGYVFKGWDKSFTNVKTNLDVYPVYNKLHTVRFLNYDGTVLKSSLVENGMPATAPTEEPTKTGYHFTNWAPAFGNITSDLDVTANFEINTYTVTFLDINDTIIGTPDIVNYDESTTPPAAPIVDGFDFVEWLGTYTNVKENSIVHSVYKVKTFEVNFYDINGNKVGDTQIIEYGKLANYPDVPSVEGKTNGVWDTASSPVYSNLTIRPIYDTVTLNVTFHAKDGSTFVTRTVPYGTGAEEPTLPSVHGFTFINWDKEFSNVITDLDVYPNYTENPKGTVTVKHTFIGDSARDGEVVLTGYYDDTFNAVPVAHDGYTYVSEGLLTGNYGEVPQTVQFTYTAIPAPTGKVFVKHENPDGTTFAEGSLLQGGYETPYTASPITSPSHNVSLKTGSSPVTGIFTADDLTVTFVYTLKEVVPPTTEAPSQEQPIVQPTTQPAQPTTVDVPDEAIAEGNFSMMNFDSLLGGTTTPAEETTEALVTEDLGDEDTPLGPTTLPKTGQLPVELFYGIGGLITAAGVFLKKKN